MDEMASPQKQPPLLEPEGDLCFVLFDGMITGPASDPHALRLAVHGFNEASAVRADIEIENRKFSILLDDQPISASNMTDSTRASLNDLVSSTLKMELDRSPIESTLRCTEVYTESVRESLIAVNNNEIEVVSRVRAVTREDLGRGPAAESLLPPGMSRRRACILFLVIAVGAVLLAWQAGYIDRIRSAKADDIELDQGPFLDTLEVTLESNWGNFHVVIKRGKTDPTNTENVEGLTQLLEAALAIVRTGDTCFVVMETADGTPLNAIEVRLRPLLEGKEVKGKLPGRSTAARLRLSLSDPEIKR